MKYQFDNQTLTLCLHFLKTGKLKMVLFILEICTRNNPTVYKEILQLNYRYYTLMNNEVTELSAEDKIINSNRIADSVFDIILEHLGGSNSSNTIH